MTTTLSNTASAILASDSDLRGSRFTDVNLRSASFHRADLSDAALSDVNMERVVFNQARLDGARFEDASLKGATLVDADLSGRDHQRLQYRRPAHRRRRHRRAAGRQQEDLIRMAKVTVDGREVEIANGSSVLQACEAAGVEIPRFCYHDRLSVAGNCRMCLVEVVKAPKPIASCSYPVAEGMEIKTDTPMVRNGRRGVMEFLLINHPLDCPICDQGGECDLQDQAFSYGSDHSRYEESKRAVKDKYLGPLVKTIMTRCIQCTRCIRFATEIAGVPELGATARGENMEVTTYVEKALTSELSGNLIDICPVGALTSKPYAFVARPWELRKTDSIDVLDAVGAAIRVDARGAEVLRMLPRTNDDVNEEWLGDKSRFSFDGLKRRRLDKPWVRHGRHAAPGSRGPRRSAPSPTSCRPARRPHRRHGRRSVRRREHAGAEGPDGRAGLANLDCRQDGARIDTSRRDFYTFNTTIAGIEEADALLIIGSNPRREAPVLNARIRKRRLAGGVPDRRHRPARRPDLPRRVARRRPGRDQRAARGVRRASGRRQAPDGDRGASGARPSRRRRGAGGKLEAMRPRSARSSAEWHGFNVLHTAAARVGALDLGFLPGPGAKTMDAMMGGGVDLLWLLGADEFDTGRIGADTFVVYQGHHGDRGAARADVILPGSAYVEKSGTYVNTEGRVQRTGKAVFAPGDARDDWAILRAFSALIDKPLPYDTIWKRCAPGWSRSTRCSAGSASCPASGRHRPVRPGRRPGGGQRRAVRPGLPRLLPDQPDQPGQRRDGGVLRNSTCRPADGGGVSMTAFLASGPGQVLITLVETLALLVPLLICVAYLTVAERKVLGAMQLRKGPNVVGFWGLLQAFADALKMFMKEQIIPTGANRVLFVIAPMITMILALIAWAVIPLTDGWAISDINVGVLYLFAISSLSVYGVIIAGWASNSKYAFLGALRSAAQMVSYEVSIGFVMVTVLLCAGTLNLTGIVRSQATIWFVVPLFPMAVVYFISALAETNRAPFDVAEGESEIVAGFMVEYSGISWALFFLGEYANMILHVGHGDDPVPGGLAAAGAAGAVHLDPRADLVHRQDRLRAVPVHLGPRHLPALPLRPADAAGLEGVPAAVAAAGWC